MSWAWVRTSLRVIDAFVTFATLELFSRTPPHLGNAIFGYRFPRLQRQCSSRASLARAFAAQGIQFPSSTDVETRERLELQGVSRMDKQLSGSAGRFRLPFVNRA